VCNYLTLHQGESDRFSHSVSVYARNRRTPQRVLALGFVRWHAQPSKLREWVPIVPFQGRDRISQRGRNGMLPLSIPHPRYRHLHTLTRSETRRVPASLQARTQLMNECFPVKTIRKPLPWDSYHKRRPNRLAVFQLFASAEQSHTRQSQGLSSSMWLSFSLSDLSPWAIYHPGL